MTTHSSILAWETQWTEEPHGLQSMGSEKSCIQLSQQNTVRIVFSVSHTHIYMCVCVCVCIDINQINITKLLSLLIYSVM